MSETPFFESPLCTRHVRLVEIDGDYGIDFQVNLQAVHTVDKFAARMEYFIAGFAVLKFGFTEKIGNILFSTPPDDWHRVRIMFNDSGIPGWLVIPKDPRYEFFILRAYERVLIENNNKPGTVIVTNQLGPEIILSGLIEKELII
jgi:hypothetical protein